MSVGATTGSYGVKICRAPCALKFRVSAPPAPVWPDPKSSMPISGWFAAPAGVRSDTTAYLNGPAVNGLAHTPAAADRVMTPEPTFSHVTPPSTVAPPTIVPHDGAIPPDVPATAQRYT